MLVNTIEAILTWLLGALIKKFPWIENDFIPAFTFGASLLLRVLGNAVGPAVAHADQGYPIPVPPAAILLPSVANWMTVWLGDVVIRKFLFGKIFGKKF